MTKELHVILDDDDETITLSNACNMYGHHRFRIYSDIASGYEFFVVVSQHNEWYMVNANTYLIVRNLGVYQSARFLFSDLLKKGYKIKLILDDEEK